MAEKKERLDVKGRTIARQVETIERLEQQVKELEIDNKAKEEIINTVDDLREEFVSIVEDLKAKSKEYDSILKEMIDLKDTLREFVFTNKYRPKK